MALAFEITTHAVDRFRERFSPEETHADARARLEHAALDAIPLREKSINGDRLWRLPSLDVVVVTRRDTGRHVAVTVLPRAATEGQHHRFMPEHLEQRQALLATKQASIASDEKRLAERQQTVAAAQAEKSIASEDAIRRAKASRALEEAEALKARRAQAVEQERVATLEIKVLKQRVALLHAEAMIIGSECKNIRHEINAGENERALKEALRLAMRALHGDITVSEAISGIEAIQPGFNKPQFRVPSKG